MTKLPRKAAAMEALPKAAAADGFSRPAAAKDRAAEEAENRTRSPEVALAACGCKPSSAGGARGGGAGVGCQGAPLQSSARGPQCAKHVATHSLPLTQEEGRHDHAAADTKRARSTASRQAYS